MGQAMCQLGTFMGGISFSPPDTSTKIGLIISLSGSIIIQVKVSLTDRAGA